MENLHAPQVVKQEPPDELNVVVEMSEVTTSQSETNSEIQKGAKKPPSEKLVGTKRKKLQFQPFPAKEEKARKTAAAEIETGNEPSRLDVFPLRTKAADFCCRICNAHMNSVQMWESHIRGKRHLKNCKKGSSSAAAAVAAPAPVQVKTEEADDVAGLFYIDTKGAQSPPHDNVIYERRTESPNVMKQECTPEAPSAPAATATSNLEASIMAVSNMTMTERINYIFALSASVSPQSEADYNEIKSIVTALGQSILQYEIRQLPLAAQQKLAKEMFRGN